MRSGDNSWRVTADVPTDLHLALFVREAAGMRLDEEGLPAPLQKPVPGLHDQTTEGNEVAATSWPSWWSELCHHRRAVSTAPQADGLAAIALHAPDFHEFTDRPALQRLVARAFRSFHPWWNAPPGSQSVGLKWELAEARLAVSRLLHEVLAEVEEELGRKARDFVLAIDVIGVTGPYSWEESLEYGLLAANLLADESWLRAWLRERLRNLA